MPRDVRHEIEGVTATCCLAAAKPCEFCGGDGQYLCDWPVDRMVVTPVQRVLHGEVIREWSAPEVNLGADAVYMRVLGIEMSGRYVHFQIEVLRSTSRSRRRADGYRLHGFTRPFNSPVDVARPGTCDRRCCEAHAREAGEDRHYCREHWHAWQGVA